MKLNASLQKLKHYFPLLQPSSLICQFMAHGFYISFLMAMVDWVFICCWALLLPCNSVFVCLQQWRLLYLTEFLFFYYGCHVSFLWWCTTGNGEIYRCCNHYLDYMKILLDAYSERKWIMFSLLVNSSLLLLFLVNPNPNPHVWVLRALILLLECTMSSLFVEIVNILTITCLSAWDWIPWNS